MNPVCLVILDGWGYAPNWGGNPISVANPKTFNMLWRSYPKTLLQASGQHVGLPGHEAGNSEVGHLNIGAGRIVRLDQTAITESIRNGSFFQNQVLLETFHKAKHSNAALHIMGLVSDGGVHSYLDHLYALLELASNQKADRVFIHVFTDGRDSAPQSALNYIGKLQEAINLFKIGEIATVSGRFFAMDRDHHFDRTKRVIDALLKGEGPQFGSALQAVAASYKQGLSDEYVIPSVILRSSGGPVGILNEKDSVIFFNFRADRARQLTQMLLKQQPGINMVTFIPYGFEKELKLPLKAVFKPSGIPKCLTQVVSEVGLGQFHIAETEKYAHVTYFFNGGVEEPFPGEERLLVPSPKVLTFASKPAMAAPEITDQLTRRIKKERYGFHVVNFASPDMVGHTGHIQAALKAVRVVDDELQLIWETCQKHHTILMVTADHGNIEQMINPLTGEPDTEHSTNPVPFIMVFPQPSQNHSIGLRSGGILADIAPTVLELMAINKPVEMTGVSLRTML